MAYEVSARYSSLLKRPEDGSGGIRRASRPASERLGMAGKIKGDGMPAVANQCEHPVPRGLTATEAMQENYRDASCAALNRKQLRQGSAELRRA
jgi:hypothetical protein